MAKRKRADLTADGLQKYFHLRQSEAAKHLGVSPSTIRRRLTELKLHWPRTDKQREENASNTFSRQNLEINEVYSENYGNQNSSIFSLKNKEMDSKAYYESKSKTQQKTRSNHLLSSKQSNELSIDNQPKIFAQMIQNHDPIGNSRDSIQSLSESNLIKSKDSLFSQELQVNQNTENLLRMQQMQEIMNNNLIGNTINSLNLYQIGSMIPNLQNDQTIAFQYLTQYNNLMNKNDNEQKSFPTIVLRPGELFCQCPGDQNKEFICIKFSTLSFLLETMEKCKERETLLMNENERLKQRILSLERAIQQYCITYSVNFDLNSIGRNLSL